MFKPKLHQSKRVFVISFSCLLTLLSSVSVVWAKQPPAPPSEQAVLYQMAENVNAERIKQDVTRLVNFGTRHTLSDTKSNTRGIGAARRWLKQQFEQISAQCGGCLKVYVQRKTISGEPRIPMPTEVVNIVAVQTGKLDPNRYVIMSGDIDSRVSDIMDSVSDAPGANDNASGLAGVLEAARILSHYQFAGSIVYAGLSGEEQGLFGGKIMAAKAKAQGWRIEAELNNDMIGNIAGINGVIDNHTVRVFSEGTRYTETAKEAKIRRFSGGEVDSPSRNLARYIKKHGEKYVQNLDVMMVYRLDRFGRGGHHRPFNELGFPAVRVMETYENYNRQHQNVREEHGIAYGDSLSGVDANFAAKLTSLNVVTLASLAMAPPPPAKVNIAGAVQASTSLTWSIPKGKQAKNLAGYKIYWRLTTESEWTHSRYVGLVNSFTLDNIMIDNYYFGVSSVASDGSESPVVFPGPTGSFGGY